MPRGIWTSVNNAKFFLVQSCPMCCISSGKPNSMIYLPLQDKSKYSSKREMPVLGERLSKLLIFLRRFISGNVASTVWLDLPILIRQSGCHSVPPLSDSEKISSVVPAGPRVLFLPTNTQPNGYLKTKFPRPHKGKWGGWVKNTKGRTMRKEKNLRFTIKWSWTDES